jgi:hypothetical protein
VYVQNSEVFGTRLRRCRTRIVRTEAALQQLTDRGSPAGEPEPEAEVVDGLQLFLRKHDLQALFSLSANHVETHAKTPIGDLLAKNAGHFNLVACV